MAAEIQTGTAVVHGIPNGGSAISITGFATFLFDAAKAGHQFAVSENKDALNFDANLTAVNEFIEVDIDFEPSGATRAAAAAVAVLPTPLSAITLANFKIALFNGVYVYMGGTTVTQMPSGATKFSGMKLRKYADSAQNTALTTTISG
jgi:hypothetical protein